MPPTVDRSTDVRKRRVPPGSSESFSGTVTAKTGSWGPDVRDVSYAVRDRTAAPMVTPSVRSSIGDAEALSARTAMSRTGSFNVFQGVCDTSRRVTGTEPCARPDGTATNVVTRKIASTMRPRTARRMVMAAPHRIGTGPSGRVAPKSAQDLSSAPEDLALTAIGGALQGTLQREPLHVLHLVVAVAGSPPVARIKKKCTVLRIRTSSHT